MLTVLPLFHVGGLNIQTTPALQIGATVTLHPRFAPDATLNALAQDTPTLTVLVPATMQAVIEHPHWAATDITCLRALTTGSTQVPQGLVDAFTARGVPVLQVYGSTETCPVAVYTRAGGDQRAGSTGLPGLVCEARVVDDAGNEVAPGIAGEVVVRGPNVFFEYWGNAAATAETLARRLVSFGRHRHARRGRAFLHPRPQEEHDHLGRREHLSGRGRARADRASRGRRRPP